MCAGPLFTARGSWLGGPSIIPTCTCVRTTLTPCRPSRERTSDKPLSLTGGPAGSHEVYLGCTLLFIAAPPGRQAVPRAAQAGGGGPTGCSKTSNAGLLMSKANRGARRLRKRVLLIARRARASSPHCRRHLPAAVRRAGCSWPCALVRAQPIRAEWHGLYHRPAPVQILCCHGDHDGA